MKEKIDALERNDLKRITVEYHRVNFLDENDKDSIKNQSHINERFVIDREQEYIELSQNMDDLIKTYKKYELNEIVDNIFEIFSDDIFENTRENKNLLPIPNQDSKYTITVEYYNKPKRTIKGSFDYNGLPTDYPDFAWEMYTAMDYLGYGDITNTRMIFKKRRKRSEYAYLSVSIQPHGDTTYYLTEDDSIYRNDFVIIYSDELRDYTIGRVEEIDFFTKKTVPVPLNEVRTVIKKADGFDDPMLKKLKKGNFN